MDIKEYQSKKYGKGWTYKLPNGEDGFVRQKHGQEKAADIIAQKWGFSSASDTVNIGDSLNPESFDYNSAGNFIGTGGKLNPLSLADEIGAAGQWVGANLPGSQSPNKDKSYSDLLKRQQAAMSIYDFANSKLSMAQRLIGGFAIGGPAGSAASKTANLASKGAQYAKNVGMGSAIGSVSGAADADGGFDMQGLMSRGLGAVEGAIIGAVVSGALPIASSLALGAWNTVKNLIQNNGQTQEVKKALLTLVDRLKDDGLDVDQAIRKTTQMGDDAIIADLGPNVAGMAKAAVQQPGPAQTKGARVLEQRQANQGERVYDSAKNQMDSKGDFKGTMDEIVGERAGKASKLYPPAYEVEIPYDEVMEESLAKLKPYIGRIWGRAKNLATLEGRQLPEMLEDAGDGSFNVIARPDMRMWDHIKRGLDEFIFSDKKNMTGKGLGATELRELKKVRFDLVKHLKEINPKYKEALDVYSGDSRLIEALETGRDFLKIDSDLAGDVLKNMSQVEKEFFREGVVRRLREVIYNTPDGSDVVRKIFGSKALRERLSSVFPNNKSFRGFTKSMLVEGKMGKTKNNILGGSQTAQLQAQQQALKDDLANWGIDLVSGNIGNAATGAVRKIIKKNKNISRDASKAMGDIFLTQGIAKNRNTLEAAKALANQQKLKMLGLDRTLSGVASAVAPQEFKPFSQKGLLY